MKTPVDALLDTVAWSETGNQPSDDGMPYATQSGVLNIAGHSLRCYRLSNGQSVFHADDVNAFFGGVLAFEHDTERGAG